MKHPLTDDQIVELEKLVPEAVPQAGDSMEVIQRYAGKRELVLFLINQSRKRERDEARKAPR